MIQKRTIGIIGTGNVGVAVAYALFIRGIASEIILVDKDFRRAEGEAMDLMHGQAFVTSVTVRAGDYKHLTAAQVIVVSAGVGQKPGETRLDLLNRNAQVLRDITRHLDRYAPQAVLIIASNPVDILTYVVQELSERSDSRVIGTGTMLDTARFRALLGQYYVVDPRSVHAYILGEHGDSEVPIWSTASIGGLLIQNRTILGRRFEVAKMDKLFNQVRNAAYEIINRKGYTNTAIGCSIVRLIEAIVEDQKSVLPVSTRLSGQYGLEDVCLSIPCVIGMKGVDSNVLLELSEKEKDGLRGSAAILKASLKEITLEKTERKAE